MLESCIKRSCDNEITEGFAEMMNQTSSVKCFDVEKLQMREMFASSVPTIITSSLKFVFVKNEMVTLKCEA